MSAGQYNKRIIVQRAAKEQGPHGVKEFWTDVKTFTGSCEYYTQYFKGTDGSISEGEMSWVIRSRNDIRVTREIGRYRFVVRQGGSVYFLYPKEFPVHKAGEWMVLTTEEEDITEQEVGVIRGPY